MNLKYLEKPEVLIDVAFAKGRKSASIYPKQKTVFYTIKGKEIAKIDAMGSYLEETLALIPKEFPSIEHLAPFYRELFILIIDANEVKKALSHLSSVSKLVKKLRIKSIVALKEMPFTHGASKDAKAISNAFFGRTTSLVKSLSKPIADYDAAVKKLRELPSIKAQDEVYLLAGLPNAGKTTLMSKITSSKPKIAAYPFTTQGLNVGSFKRKHLSIQVIDTPGLLDRPLLERNKIELKAITALQYLKGTIIFVVDPFQDIETQKKLFGEIKKLFSDKGFIVVINKIDLAEEKVIEEAKAAFEDAYVIVDGNESNNLKKELKIDETEA